MLPVILLGTTFLGLTAALLIDDFKKFQDERNNINIAKDTSEQNRTVGNILTIESSTTGVKLNSDFTNSQLLNTKPMSYRISEFTGGTSEKDIVNRYAEATKKLLDINPNAETNCTLISETKLITEEDCLKVHGKEYSFFHKLDDGKLAYNISDENIKKYTLQIEAHKYNLKTEDIDNNNKIILDTRFVNSYSPFLNKKSEEISQNIYSDVKKNLSEDNYLLASASLYNLKKNNYQVVPVATSLYSNLIEKIEQSTKDAQEGTEDYELRLKVQTEFLKLTKDSNIVENLTSNNNEAVNSFIKSVADNYSTIETKETYLTGGVNSIPTKDDFLNKLSKISN